MGGTQKGALRRAKLQEHLFKLCSWGYLYFKTLILLLSSKGSFFRGLSPGLKCTSTYGSLAARVIRPASLTSRGSEEVLDTRTSPVQPGLSQGAGEWGSLHRSPSCHLSLSFWSCLSASPHGAPSEPPAAPKHEMVTHLSAFLGRNSCKLSPWVL